MLPKVFEAGGAGVDEASGFLQRFMLIRAEREKPGYISPTSAYITPTCGEGLKDIGAQGPPTCPTCPTCDSGYLSEFDFNDPNFPDEVKI